MQSHFYQKYLTYQNILCLTIISAVGLLGFAFVLEYFVDLVPCPLCIVQRFFYLLIGLTALGGIIWPKILTRLRSLGLVVVWAILGGSVALRQVILQHQPPDVESTGCAVSFGSFLDSFLYALGGRGNCGIIDWTFLSFSIAEWSLVCFVGYLGLAVLLLVTKEDA